MDKRKEWLEKWNRTETATDGKERFVNRDKMSSEVGAEFGLMLDYLRANGYTGTLEQVRNRLKDLYGENKKVETFSELLGKMVEVKAVGKDEAFDHEALVIRDYLRTWGNLDKLPVPTGAAKDGGK